MEGSHAIDVHSLSLLVGRCLAHHHCEIYHLMTMRPSTSTPVPLPRNLKIWLSMVVMIVLMAAGAVSSISITPRELGPAIDAIIAQPQFARSRWSVLVVSQDADTESGGDAILHDQVNQYPRRFDGVEVWYDRDSRQFMVLEPTSHRERGRAGYASHAYIQAQRPMWTDSTMFIGPCIQ